MYTVSLGRNRCRYDPCLVLPSVSSSDISESVTTFSLHFRSISSDGVRDLTVLASIEVFRDVEGPPVARGNEDVARGSDDVATGNEGREKGEESEEIELCGSVNAEEDDDAAIKTGFELDSIFEVELLL